MKKILLCMLLLVCATGNAIAEKNISIKTGAKMKVYLPEDDKANGRAVVLCPGGGYSYLADANEGTDWAEWFNNQGYVVAVLYYRMPEKKHATYPLEDVTEAVLYLRRRGETWHINNGCVGVMGFSAGGHVASTLATHAEADARPDFQILFYPVITMDPSYTHMGSHDNLLGTNATVETETLYSNEKQVTADTPPAFITYAADDSTVPTTNSTNYSAALKEHGVSVYVKEYASGGHGFGWYKASFAYHDDLLNELGTWLGGLDSILPNAIDKVGANNSTTLDDPPTMIYTIDGRSVGTTTDNLPHGIYISHGRKVTR